MLTPSIRSAQNNSNAANVQRRAANLSECFQIEWGVLQRTIMQRTMLQRLMLPERMLQRTFLSIKSECCSQHRCYKEGGGILFIMESSIIVFTRESLFMLLSSSGSGPFKFHLQSGLRFKEYK